MHHWALKELKDGAEIRLSSHWKRYCDFVLIKINSTSSIQKEKHNFILNFRQAVAATWATKMQTEYHIWMELGFVLCFLGVY